MQNRVFIGLYLAVFAAVSAVGNCTGTSATIYHDISQRSLAERRAAVRSLDSTTQSELWIHHVDWYIGDHPNLSLEELHFLADLKTALATSFNTPELDRQTAVVIQTFGDEEAQNIIATLGPPESVAGGVTPRQGVLPRDLPLLDDICKTGPDCDCNWDGPNRCLPCGNGYRCVYSTSGCGLWWQETCHGRRY
jgi:hypothetical protein